MQITPHKAQYRPGEQVLLYTEGLPGKEALPCAIYHLGRLVHKIPCLPDTPLAWTPPATGGYLVRLGSGEESCHTAFDVCAHWSDAPRYGFLSDYGPLDAKPEKLDAMTALHLNVIQFYDWMRGHDTLTCQDEVYTDAMGKQINRSTLQALLALCHERGMKTMGYAAVYGAQPAYVQAHPEQALYNSNSQPLQFLANILFTNLGNAQWRSHILGEFQKALAFGFDGLHLDQYGWPKEALDAQGRVRSLSQDFPAFIQAAREALPGAGLIFNAVNAFPLETVANTGQDCVYVEVWPPNETYFDLWRIIRHARTLAPQKQVILSAYLHPFHPESGADMEQAQNGALLTMAAIFASGGFHLLLGEGLSALTGAYYSDYRTIEDAGFAGQLQSYYNFITAYGELLFDRDSTDITETYAGKGNNEYTFSLPGGVSQDTGLQHLGSERASFSQDFSIHAQAGCIWTQVRQAPGYRLVQLVNLRGLAETAWNAPKPRPLPARSIEVAVKLAGNVGAVLCASPEENGGEAQELEFTFHNGVLRFTVPRLAIWSMLIIQLEE